MTDTPEILDGLHEAKEAAHNRMWAIQTYAKKLKDFVDSLPEAQAEARALQSVPRVEQITPRTTESMPIYKEVMPVVEIREVTPSEVVPLTINDSQNLVQEALRKAELN